MPSLLFAQMVDQTLLGGELSFAKITWERWRLLITDMLCVTSFGETSTTRTKCIQLEIRIGAQFFRYPFLDAFHDHKPSIERMDCSGLYQFRHTIHNHQMSLL